MRALHLDEHFRSCGYDIKYKKFRFPGGETQIQIQDDFFNDVFITQVIRSGDDIMEIALAVDALRRIGIKKIDLFIPYVPYARQDRVMNYGEALSIKVFAQLINSLNFRRVYVFDPHSDVTTALLNNCYAINNHHFIKFVLNDFLDNEKLYLICPDTGATKKIKDLAVYLSSLDMYDIEIIQCDKTRNVKTGKITGFKVYSDKLDFSDGPCLIVDDICDGGGTFIGLGNQLLNFNPQNLYLAVSHGIFSKGINELTNGLFDKIFTTNSFNNPLRINASKTDFLTEYQLQLEV